MALEIFDAKKSSLSDEEVRAIVEIEDHPQVRTWLYVDVGENPETEFRGYRKFLKKLPSNLDADVLVAKYDGKLAGFLALWRLGRFMAHVASIGISIHPDCWGKGIASRLITLAIELAKEKGIKRLEIETLAENESMRSVVEALGFISEGTRM